MTNEPRIDVNWEFLRSYTETGGTEIVSYELQMNDGDDEIYTEVVGYTIPFTLNSVLITSSVTSGKRYNFRYRAQNVQGWGNFS